MTEVLPQSSLTVVAVGLEFPESPRWYDSALYFSDMFGRRVCRVTDDGGVQHIVDVPNRPSGLGWLPDGRLLIVSMVDNQILAHDGVEVIGWSDLSSLVAGSSNDMVVDQHGRAYVGATGYNPWVGESIKPGVLALVHENGPARVVADDVGTPNGLAISSDGARLIVAETHRDQLVSFQIGTDGSLDDRRVFATLRVALMVFVSTKRAPRGWRFRHYKRSSGFDLAGRSHTSSKWVPLWRLACWAARMETRCTCAAATPILQSSRRRAESCRLRSRSRTRDFPRWMSGHR